MNNQDNTQAELREQLYSQLEKEYITPAVELANRENLDDAMWQDEVLDPYLDKLQAFITSHTNKAIADVLDRLEEEAVDADTEYTNEDNRKMWNEYKYLMKQAIQAERQKLTNKEMK